MKNEHIFLHPLPNVEVDLSPYGAGLVSYKIDGVDMVNPGPWDFDSKNEGYNGQFVAPLVGRIQNGKLGKFVFPLNEGTKSLHSATLSVCWKKFECEIVEEKAQIDVVFVRQDEIFDGKFQSVAHYVFSKEKPTFRLELSLISDIDLPVNLTSHLYFTLGEAEMKDVMMTLPSSLRCEYDEQQIPLRFIPVEGKFDMRKGRHLDEPLDHAFLLDEKKLLARGKRYEMTVTTSAKAVGIYRLPKAGFTLEFIDHPLLGEECILPAGKSETMVAEYAFRRI